MAMCKCGKCADCKKRMAAKKDKNWAGSPADKKTDKKLEKGMTPAQKKRFEAADKKMDAKKPSKKDDERMDKALAARIKGKKK